MKFSFKTFDGCKRLLALLLIILLVSSFMGRLIQTDFAKVKVENVRIDSRGAAIDAELYYPAGTSSADKLPAILTAHGGDCNMGVMRYFALELARRGFVVLNTNATLTGMSDQPKYDEAGQGVDEFNFRVAYNGVLDSLEFLRGLEFVDKTRIGATGHSLGARRAIHAAADDAGYFTLNDIMINVLAEDFGQSFTAEEIYEDADKLAADRLSEDQFTHYMHIREEQAAVYDTRVKAVLGLGSGAAAYASQGTVVVGGHEVYRSTQANLAYATGTYDFGFTFSGSAGALSDWNAQETINEHSWYSIDDRTVSNTELGVFGEITPSDDAALAEAIAEGKTRLFVCTGDETHSKEFFSVATMTVVLDYFTELFNYNTAGIASDSQIWVMDAICNFIGLLCIALIILTLACLLVNGKKFQLCVGDVHQVDNSFLSKGKFALLTLLTVVLVFFTMHISNKKGASFFAASKLLPFSTTGTRGVFLVFMLALVSLVITALYLLFAKMNGRKCVFSHMNFAMPVKHVLSTVLVALIAFVAGYIAFGVCYSLFGQDFRFWMASIGPLKSEYWIIGIPYFLMLFFGQAVAGVGVNIVKRNDIPEWLDTLIIVVVNSLGIYLCALVNLIIAKNNPAMRETLGLWSNFMGSYQFLVWVPLTTYITRKAYDVTRTVWMGAAINAGLLTWSIASTVGVADYFGQGILSIFFNM